jgi:hypothetical protein
MKRPLLCLTTAATHPRMSRQIIRMIHAETHSEAA